VDEELFKTHGGVIVEWELEMSELNYRHEMVDCQTMDSPDLKRPWNFTASSIRVLEIGKSPCPGGTGKGHEEPNPISISPYRKRPFFSHVPSQITDSMEQDRLQSKMAALL